MLSNLGKKIGQQLVVMGVLLLLLFAAYLSLGRQFMPAIRDYKSLVEARLFQATGVPVSIDALSGRFEGFNPVIAINGLRIQIPVQDDADSGQPGDPDVVLEFDRATVILDVARSLLQRRWVLENFVVERMEASAVQDESGEWRLRGLNTIGPDLSIDDIYNTLLRVSRLELRSIAVEMQTRDGVRTRLTNGEAVIQNRGNNHFFHIDANLGSTPEQLRLSVEVTGNSLAAVSGRVHLRLPDADYSQLLGGQQFRDWQLGNLSGGGELWLEMSRGQLSRAIAQGSIDSLTLLPDDRQQVALTRLSTTAVLTRNITSGAWDLDANDLSFIWNERIWPLGDVHLRYSDSDELGLQARLLDVEMAAGLGSALGLSSDGLQDALQTLQPRGGLNNFNLRLQLESGEVKDVSLVTNLQNLALNSYRNNPSVSGAYGYLQLDYTAGQQAITGRAEVDSDRFAINLPTVFLDTWHYDRVNGAVDFRIDLGAQRRVHIVSNVIHASSEIVDGRVQFESDTLPAEGGAPRSLLTLLIGAQNVKGSLKTPYLPSTDNQRPGLLNTMRWLDTALINADVRETGIILRATLGPGTSPLRSTFQSYYDFSNGHLKYQEQWPELQQVRGRVMVEDRITTIAVDGGTSAGMQLGTTTGLIAPNEDDELWLSVEGRLSGATEDAISFLRSAPLNVGLDRVMNDWQAQGNVNAEVTLQVPLSASATPTQVDVRTSLEGNTLQMPELDLEFADLSGKVNYSSAAGLYDSELQSSFFAAPATIKLTTQTQDSNTEHLISVTGAANNEVLTAWRRQPQFVRELLRFSSGEFNYQAALHVPAAGGQSRLVIDSNLQGLAFEIPAPLGKTSEGRRPLHLELGIGEGSQALQLQYGSDLNARMQIDAGVIREGVAYVGTLPGLANPWALRADKPGLEIRGNLDRFIVSEWLNLLDRYSAQASAARGLGDTVSLVQLDVGNLDLFGQVLPLINVEIQHPEDSDYWAVGLNGDAVAGSVLVPFNDDDYIEAYLAYLYLPGPPPATEETENADAAAGEEEVEIERVDPLTAIDPRRFPKLKFHTGSFKIGERDYGLGRFTLDPDANGAEFSGLVGNFRGLILGDGEAQTPGLTWAYNGQNHHTYLTGLISAGDLAAVLRTNGFAASLESTHADFNVELDWPGSPAFFTTAGLSGDVVLQVEDGRFLQRSGGSGALKLISILNFDAIMRRLRFSDDLLRRGLAYDDITGHLTLNNGVVTINDRLIISGPSSVYQISGQLNLVQQTINGEMYVTLPVSDNIPWLGLLTANIPLAIGAYLFQQIFGDQVDNLTSAQYTLQGPWEGLEPQFKQAFGTRGSPSSPPPAQ